MTIPEKCVVSGDVWSHQFVVEVAKSARTRVFCIAYVTQDLGSAFREGDCLVCDASKKAVSCGETDPAFLLNLVRRGVSVYSCEALHAKCAVFDDWALIGSANLSASSADRLIELSLLQRNQQMSVRIHAFILGLIKSRNAMKVSESQLLSLKKFWRTEQKPWQLTKARHKHHRSSLPGNHIVTVFQNINAPRGISQDELDESASRAESVVEMNGVSLHGRKLESYYSSEKTIGQSVGVGDSIFVVEYSSRKDTARARVFGPGTVVLVEKKHQFHIVHYLVPDEGFPYGKFRASFGYGQTVNRRVDDATFVAMSKFIKRKLKTK